MLKEAMGKFSKLLLVIAASAVLAGCGNSVEDKAQALLAQAREAYETGEWDTSLQRLSEIDSLYKSAVKTRRVAMHLRPQVIEKQTLEKLSANDSLLAVSQWTGDSLSKSFRCVDNAVERYYVTKNSPSDIGSRPGLYGRMSPDGVLYFMAVSPGVQADMISLDGATSSVLPHDGERRDRAGNNQVMTFLEGEVEPIILMLAHSTGSQAELVFFNNGSRTGKLTLSGTDVEALSHACQTATQFRKFKVLELEKQRLERTLAVARNQIARTTPDTVAAR